MTKFSTRRFDHNTVQALINRGYSEPLARALSARGVKSLEDMNYDLHNMLAPDQLLNCEAAGARLADAIQAQKKIMIIGDYDCDGATSVSLARLGLRALGAKNVDYLIPDREKDGYGLSTPLVKRAAERKPDLIITVDNGISSYDAVEYAKSLGIDVIVTDHHLPGSRVPDTLIVNPNQHGDTFPSKSLAGVGVMFYVLLATRAELRKRNAFAGGKQPNLLNFIDLVSLGTVADVVPLDRNNRILVSKGLERMREGRMQPGISALLTKSRKNTLFLNASDLGFLIGPRINAAGRLDSIELGVECLCTSDYGHALDIADQLESFNKKRRSIEDDMQAEALIETQTIAVGETNSIAIKGDNWHSGVVGIVASRIKEKTYRPTIAFAPSEENGVQYLKGSGRSIPGIHLRDVLDLVDKRNPGMIVKFGGHAMAAGLTIHADKFELFKEAFEAAITDTAQPGAFEKNVLTDGELSAGDFNAELVREIRSNVWGQGFTEPLFANHFRVLSQKILKDQHLKLVLETDGRTLNAIWFRRRREIPENVHLAYKLDLNEWAGRTSVQLIVESMEDEVDDWGA